MFGCNYCYAAQIAKRFTPKGYECSNCQVHPDCPGKSNKNKCPDYRNYTKSEKIHILDSKKYIFYPKKRCITFPFGFEPTLHRYRLSEPEKQKESAKIFVCSMSDMFGDWIPTGWIEEIFDICRHNPQHTYMFLTKNPTRYRRLAKEGKLPSDDNMYYGTTITQEGQHYFYSNEHKTFLSIEPIQSEFSSL
jgi:protein gp37